MHDATDQAALYVGSVMHRRFGDHAYSFRYRLFNLLLDVDRLDAAAGRSRLFSRNRFNLFSFHDRDHGPRDGSPLRPWIEDILARVGIALAGGRVQILCMPRVLGYGFNPLSLWYCYNADGGLRAVLCEVRNTFGEWHGYLLHDHGNTLSVPLRSRAAKVFHVSPFFPVSGEYRFRVLPAGDRFVTGIQYIDGGQLRLSAVQHGNRRPLNDRELLRAGWRYPFMSLWVVASIHWQALKLWRRGGTFHRKPQPPQEDVT